MSSPLTPSITNPDFGFVLLAAATITFHFTFVTFSVAGVRYKVFNDEYIAKNLKAANQDVINLNGKGIGKGCHPDTGLGRFSDALTTEQWMELNLAQRCSGNYLEQLTSIIVLLVTAGLFYPRFAAAVGAVYIVSRILYTYGFKQQLKKTGLIKSRGLGFAGAMLCHIALLAASVYASLVMTGTISELPFLKK